MRGVRYVAGWQTWRLAAEELHHTEGQPTADERGEVKGDDGQDDDE